jgi:8-oxo-dGTP pyrophosphatase MutT (NUDIX family)
MSADEIVDIVDQDNQILRQATKLEAHKHGWLHRTVLAEVRDPEGRIVLVEQASDRQDPGQYVCPVGGHVRTGETEEEALDRETEEEIGMRNVPHQLQGRLIYDRKVLGRQENHFFIVYMLTCDPAQFSLGDEAVGYKTFTPAELKQAILDTPQMFGPPQLFLLKQFHPELLP